MSRSPNVLLRFVCLGILTLDIGCRKAEQPTNSVTSTQVVDNSSRPAEPATISGGSFKSLGKFERTRRASDQTGPLFTHLDAEQTGIDFTISWDKPAKFDRVFYSQNTGGGVCIGDYDGDGLPDVYLTSPSGGNRLFRNSGQLKFEDVTAVAGLSDEEFWGTGASFVDIDNDGDLDLYACQYMGANRLYVNDGKGKFDAAKDAWGMNFDGASVMMAFADYDRDGDLDGYLVTSGLPPRPDQKFKVRFEGKKPVVLDELRELWNLLYLPGDKAKQIETGQFDRLYRNDGIGPDGRPRFTNVAKEAGIDGADIGQSATWFDFDNDGLPDLYVANDYWGADYLYRNNGDGTFTDIAKHALPHTPWSSMGADFADINQDGLFDLLATDMAGSNHFRQKVGMGDMASAGWFLEYAEPRQYSRNALYVNSGTEQFMEAAFLSGLASTDWTWTPRFEDFDNDGLVDVFITNGMTRDFTNSDLNEKAKSTAAEGSPEFFRFWREQGVRKDQNVVYRNLGNLQFEDASKKWGFDRVGASFGAATGDLDADGDIDIIVNNVDTTAMVYRNDSKSGNALRLKLTGSHSNRSALGATVRVHHDGNQQTQYLTMSRGWTSSSEPVLHFGLGESEQSDRIEVHWPNGGRSVMKDVAANGFYEIVEARASEELPAANILASGEHPPPVSFQRSGNIDNLKILHQETTYDDFKDQPLLPNKLSQLGPGIACADFNADGRDDFYVGGAANQPGVFLISEAAGYRRETPQLFQTHKVCEDMGAMFLDADADGDFDLYVASGGYEFPAKHGLYRDRLYLNQDGVFSLAKSDDMPVAFHSGSVVCGADYDRDGDIDLFVGSRVKPGEYPAAPTSQLLENQDGSFKDVIEQDAAGLKQAGMVTGACWSDVNSDGWIDLIVAYEWGPIRCFMNDQGRLTDATASAGFGSHLGWWNSISSGDIDNDGDIDFVVGNFGLNTKYHASAEHPASIYYGDFDGSGTRRIVESEYEGSSLFPVRGKSCSTNAIPVLAERFTTFKDFGIAELNDIYTDECLNKADKFSATTLQSGQFINDGSGHFTFTPLPRISQIAPIFGSSLVDLNADGLLDLYVVQNFYGPQRETGYMNGGVSLLLLGDGMGQWQPVAPHQSGLVVSGDAKSLVQTDFNGDGSPDFLVGQNNGSLVGFESDVASADSKVLLLRLNAGPGNPSGIGSTIRLNDVEGQKGLQTVTSGSGYLSQGTAEICIALPKSQKQVSLEVTWPDGATSLHDVDLAAERISRHNIGR